MNDGQRPILIVSINITTIWRSENSKTKVLLLGKTYLDIREYFNSAKGLMPGKKGVTLKREQWNAFRDAFFDIDEKIVSLKKGRKKGHL